MILDSGWNYIDKLGSRIPSCLIGNGKQIDHRITIGNINSGKVTTRKIKEAIKLLLSQTNAVKAAYLQFKSPGQYTKWFNKIPLLGTTGATLYLTTEQEENKSN